MDDHFKKVIQEFFRKPEVIMFIKQKSLAYQHISIQIRDEGVGALDEIRRSWTELYEELKLLTHYHLHSELGDLAEPVAARLHEIIETEARDSVCRHDFQRQRYDHNLAEVHAAIAVRVDESTKNVSRLLEELGISPNGKFDGRS